MDHLLFLKNINKKLYGLVKEKVEKENFTDTQVKEISKDIKSLTRIKNFAFCESLNKNHTDFLLEVDDVIEKYKNVDKEME